MTFFGLRDFFTMQFLECSSRAILSQLGAHLGPTWLQLGLQNPPKMVPRPLPKAIFPVKVQTLILHNAPTLLLDFYCPPGSWEAHFRLKIGVFTQRVIRVLLGPSFNPLWCR